MSFATADFTIGSAKGLLQLLWIRRPTNGAGARHEGSPWLASVASSATDSLLRRDTRAMFAGEKTSGGGGGEGTSSSAMERKRGSSKEENSVEAIVLEIVLSTVAAVIVYTLGVGVWTLGRSVLYALRGHDDSGHDVDQVKSGAVSRLTAMLKKRGREVKTPLRLTSHESHLAEDIIDPDDIDDRFVDIGGMDHIKQEIWELAILPLLRPELFRSKSKLLQQPSGILLYGKPGCGKTLLAKAIAKESAAVFIPIKLSKILNKWVGESNKLVNATFSLAQKLAPSVIFLDEVHCFLSDSVDPSASKSMESLKAEFLTLWDGISTNGNHAPVLVLGATNHPHLIDQAILRRMPRTFAIPLPNKEGRLQILTVLMKDQPMDESAVAFLPSLAFEHSQGYSGSDLKELCRTAAREPIREITSEQARRAVMGDALVPKPTEGDNDDEEEVHIRPVSKADFQVALSKVKRTGQAAREYGRKTAAENARQDALVDLTPAQVQQLYQYILANPPQLPSNGPNGSNDSDGVDDVPQLPDVENKT